MKIAVGISGGVDSAVAALLCKEQGHEVIGVMMKIWDERFADHKCDPERDACFGPEEACIEDASKLCDQIGIPLHLIDCSVQFQSEIISYFSSSYLSGLTPNPCVFCNQKLKFGLLQKLLFENVSGIDKFATGHYARLIHDQSGQPHLHRGSDLQKDQSYFLHRLTKEQLSMACFPIGHLTKSEVRQIAFEAKIHVWNKHESQDFYSGDYRTLINTESRSACHGDIIDTTGRKVGVHNGIWNYTVGQRKGLGVSSKEPLYVVEIDPVNNAVIVGNSSELQTGEIVIGNLNQLEPFPSAAACRIRSSSPFYKCTISDYSESKLLLKFDTPIGGASPGQSAVLYDGDMVLGGGVIERNT